MAHNHITITFIYCQIVGMDQVSRTLATHAEKEECLINGRISDCHWLRSETSAEVSHFIPVVQRMSNKDKMMREV